MSSQSKRNKKKRSRKKLNKELKEKKEIKDRNIYLLGLFDYYPGQTISMKCKTTSYREVKIKGFIRSTSLEKKWDGVFDLKIYYVYYNFTSENKGDKFLSSSERFNDVGYKDNISIKEELEIDAKVLLIERLCYEKFL